VIDDDDEEEEERERWREKIKKTWMKHGPCVWLTAL